MDVSRWVSEEVLRAPMVLRRSWAIRDVPVTCTAKWWLPVGWEEVTGGAVGMGRGWGGHLEGWGLTVEGVLHVGVLLDDAEHGEERVVQPAGEDEEEQRRDALQQLHHLRGAGSATACAPPQTTATSWVPRQPLTMFCSSSGCMAKRHGKMTVGSSAWRRGSSVRLCWALGEQSGSAQPPGHPQNGGTTTLHPFSPHLTCFLRRASIWRK